MKYLHFFFLIIIFPVMSISASSCKNKTDESADSKFGTASIRVYRNGVLITEYTDTGVRATLDGGDLFAEFSSGGNKHVLSLTINNLNTGVFPVKDLYEPESAHLLYYSEDLPEFSPGNIGQFNFPAGSLTLEKVANNKCNGSFEANGVHGADGQNYKIEGTFDIPYQEI